MKYNEDDYSSVWKEHILRDLEEFEEYHPNKPKHNVESLVKECLKNGITISGVELCNGEFGYYIDGFSKSGTAFLYTDGDKVLLKTRYERIDEIETFEDIAGVAYEWNEGYCDRNPFGWDKCWTVVFENFGWKVNKEKENQ